MPQYLTPDICIIGAGSGGLSVAAAAAAFGVDVVLVERGKMGGDCLNHGCVPSKSLIAAANHAEAMRRGGVFGIRPVEPDIDFAAVQDHVQGVIEAIAPHDSVERFEGLGVNVIQAEGRFADERTLVAGDQQIRARRFVIATGSSPLVPEIPGLDGVDYLTNETVFKLRACPDHLVILGGGAVGLELAQAHRRLGARITVIERASCLAKEDTELVAMALTSLRGEGIDILENHSVVRVDTHEAGIRVALRDPGGGISILHGSHLLIAAGRAPNLSTLDLSAARVDHDERGVVVDDRLRSSNQRIHAIGDAAGGPQFTHVANYHAGIVIRSMLFRLPAKVDYAALPRAIFLDPELAQIGLTEAEARQRHKDVHVLSWPLSENDRAKAEHATTGRIKLIAARRGRIVGVSILGKGAAEMGNFWSLALSRRMTLRDVAGFVSPYPTFGEIGKRAATSYFADMARKPFVRRIVRLLRAFG